MIVYKLAVVVVAACTWSGNAVAGMSIEERLERMEKRMRYLEQRVQSQDELIREKDRAIAELRQHQQGIEPRWQQMEERLAAERARPGGWFERVEVSGLVEVEASHASPYVGKEESDIVLATVELGIASRLNDWVAAEMLFLHEEDDTDLEVDVGTITVADPNGPWALTAGQFYLPFGVFETQMVSDPLTLEIGEIRESSIMAGIESNGLSAGAFVFNGDNDTGGGNRIDNWGVVAGYTAAREGAAFSVTAGYLNNLGDSDALQDTIADNVNAIAAAGNGGDAGQAAKFAMLDAGRDDVEGWFASAVVSTGRFTLIGEYLAAGSDFMANELADGIDAARPEAWNLEAGVGFTLAGRDANFAVGVQGTDDAVALGLPERRTMTALSVAVMENTALSFEWAHDEDYGARAGGTGRGGDTVTAQLAVEF